MRNLKRILAVLMALLMLAVVVACKDNKTTDAPESKEPSVSPSVEASESPVPTLDVFSEIPPVSFEWGD